MERTGLKHEWGAIYWDAATNHPGPQGSLCFPLRCSRLSTVHLRKGLPKSAQRKGIRERNNITYILHTSCHKHYSWMLTFPPVGTPASPLFGSSFKLISGNLLQTSILLMCCFSKLRQLTNESDTH